MSTATFTVRVYLRAQKLGKKGTAPIYIQIKLHKEEMHMTTNQAISPKFWNQKVARVVNHPEAGNINSYLDSFTAKIRQAYSQLFIAHQEITLAGIKALVLGEAAVKKHMLIDVAEEHNKNFEALIGKKYSYGSYKNYTTTLKYLK